MDDAGSEEGVEANIEGDGGDVTGGWRDMMCG